MQIAVKCWTPEWYDAVSHAVIEIDLSLVDNLLAKLALASRIKVEQEILGNYFMGLEFDSYDPLFIYTTHDIFGLSEEGYIILPAKLDGLVPFASFPWKEAPISPCFQMVIAGKVDHHRLPDHVPNGRVYWYGYDKHMGAESRIETYSLYEQDLRDIKNLLKTGIPA